MPKKTLKTRLRLLAILPLLLTSCAQKPSTPPNEPSTTERTTPLLPLPSPMEGEWQAEEQSDAFWDVSDVDISEIDETRKLLSFTFDDAPSRTIERLLATFAAFNEENPDCRASATFFCNGRYFDESTPTLLQTAHAMGMELGNHSFSHPDLSTLSPSEIQAEIDETDELLRRADGKRRHLFRAPYGKLSEQVKAVVETPIIDWTIDTLDWNGVTAEQIYEVVWAQKYDGAIVLMHDGYDATVYAVKRLLPALKEAGYQVASVSKTAKAHACPLKKGSVYIRARKQSK